MRRRGNEIEPNRGCGGWLYLIALAILTTPAFGQAAAAVQQSERKLVVSVPDRKLAVVEDGRVVKVYPVAVGADVTPSPTGTFHVVNRVVHPTYYHAGKVIPPGRQNPLGTHWMGLSRKSYGIHGTNQPKSIGKAASHGCIRMAHADLEELFSRVRVGDVVEIHAERDEAVAALFAPPATPADATAAESTSTATSTEN